MADQRRKRKLGGELAWQDGIVRWRWSKGWLPKGFTAAFGRVWWRLRDISLIEREKAISGWLAACHVDDNNIFYGPGLKNGEITWPDREKKKINMEYDPALDKQVKAGIAMLQASPGHPDDLCPEDVITLNKWKARYDAWHYRALYAGIYIE